MRLSACLMQGVGWDGVCWGTWFLSCLPFSLFVLCTLESQQEEIIRYWFHLGSSEIILDKVDSSNCEFDGRGQRKHKEERQEKYKPRDGCATMLALTDHSAARQCRNSRRWWELGVVARCIYLLFSNSQSLGYCTSASQDICRAFEPIIVPW